MRGFFLSVEVYKAAYITNPDLFQSSDMLTKEKIKITLEKEKQMKAHAKENCIVILNND